MGTSAVAPSRRTSTLTCTTLSSADTAREAPRKVVQVKVEVRRDGATNLDLDLHDLEQRRHRARGAALLPVPEQTGERDDREDQRRIGGIAQDPGQDRRHDQDEHDRALELPDEEAQLGGPAAAPDGGAA